MTKLRAPRAAGVPARADGSAAPGQPFAAGANHAPGRAPGGVTTRTPRPRLPDSILQPASLRPPSSITRVSTVESRTSSAGSAPSPFQPPDTGTPPPGPARPDGGARARHEMRQRLLVEAGTLFAASHDVEATVRRIVELAVPDFADWAAFNVLGETGETVRTVAIHHHDPARRALAAEIDRRYPIRAGTGAGVARVLRTGAPELIPDIPDAVLEAVADDAEHLALLRGIGFRSLLYVPLVARGRILGALGFGTSESDRRLDAADLAFAQELAQRAALALDNAQLYAQEREARRAAERLQLLTAALSGSATPAAIGAVVLEHGVRALGADRGVLALATPEGDELAIVASTGYPEAACMGAGRRWPIGAPIPIAEAVRTGLPVAVESRAAWAARYGGTYDPRGQGNAAWVALPLVGAGDVRGALLWTYDDAHPVSADERALLETIARLCAQALERARLLEGERAARREAEAANQAKSQFLTTMSHELRTPLNAIAGYVDLLRLGVRGPLTDAQAADLARVQQAQRKLLALINDVLNFARLEAGHLRLELAPVPVDALLDTVVPLVLPQLEAHGLRLEREGGGDGAPALVVRADAEKAVQVLLNVLANAVKFTPAGGCVTVGATAADGWVRLHVRDTGVGIPADRLEAIFEPFVQVDSSLTRTAEGTGLGLAISRDLARAMGGELTARSVVGEGSEFVLALPVTEEGARE